MTLRLALFALTTVVAGCSTVPQAPPEHGVIQGHTCEASEVNRFLGQYGDGAVGAAIMRATHAAVLRWAPPGVMLTMEYRSDRVTVRLGPDRKITSIQCG